MKLYRLSGQDEEWLQGQPESAMGLQIIDLPSTEAKLGFLYVIGGQVAVTGESAKVIEKNGLNWSWTLSGSPTARESAFNQWHRSLSLLDIPMPNKLVVPRGGAFPPFGTPNAAPPVPPYGHLPFQGICDGTEVFYRWEPFAQSKRIDQATGAIKPGTFTAPASDVAFVACGFGAVARYALPNLWPAIYRWELRPPAKTRFRCGASVPLFGQSGGGVEFEFPSGFTNVGSIANPFVLPPF